MMTKRGFTDPDSRIMKHAGGGFEQSYNAHTAVDAERQIIVAAELAAGYLTYWQPFKPT